MVTDNLCCQLRTLSQKVGAYHFCDSIKLTFCNFLQRILFPVLIFLAFPINFKTTIEALRQGHFLDIHVVDFIKNDQFTISTHIIFSID